MTWSVNAVVDKNLMCCALQQNDRAHLEFSLGTVQGTVPSKALERPAGVEPSC